jgi:hypothetical protein
MYLFAFSSICRAPSKVEQNREGKTCKNPHVRNNVVNYEILE